jgi:hypothetical protein
MTTGHYHGLTTLVFPSPEELGVMTISWRALGTRAELKGKTLTPFPWNRVPGSYPGVWFEYGFTETLGLETAHKIIPQGIPEDFLFTALTDTLGLNQPYYFRAAATDGTRIAYGQTIQLTLTDNPPGMVNMVGHVTSLIHRFSKGFYTLEIGLGDFRLDEKEGYDPRTWGNAAPEVGVGEE